MNPYSFCPLLVVSVVFGFVYILLFIFICLSLIGMYLVVLWGHLSVFDGHLFVLGNCLSGFGSHLLLLSYCLCLLLCYYCHLLFCFSVGAGLFPRRWPPTLSSPSSTFFYWSVCPLPLLMSGLSCLFRCSCISRRVGWVVGMYCLTLISVLCISDIVISLFVSVPVTCIVPSVSYFIVTWYVSVSRFKLAAPFPMKWGIISFGITWVSDLCCGFGVFVFVLGRFCWMFLCLQSVWLGFCWLGSVFVVCSHLLLFVCV